MKLKEIKKDGFYTDGKTVYFKYDSKEFAKFCEDKKQGGLYTANVFPFEKENEVEKVTADAEYFDGKLKIVDVKTVDYLKVGYEYITKQFADKEEAEKYAKEIGYEIFEIQEYKEYLSVEFFKAVNVRLTKNFKELI